MRTAIGLGGHYSDWWKKNWQGGGIDGIDLFMCPYDATHLPHKDLQLATRYSVVRPRNMSDLEEVHEMKKQEAMKDSFKHKCMKLINEHERDNGFTYDNYILARFDTVYINASDRFHVISDDAVLFDMHPEVLADMDMTKRGKVLRTLFGDKVQDYANLVHQPAHEIVFFIPSVVRVSRTNLLNYYTFNRRTIFSDRERYEQTLEQVKSLKSMAREKGVDAKIYLLEGSSLTFSEMAELSEYCDIVLFNRDRIGDYHANKNKNKALYELYVVDKMLELVQRFSWCFKAGGRYSVPKGFNLAQYLAPEIAMKIIPAELSFSGKPIAECVIYSVPRSVAGVYQQFLQDMMKLLTYDPSIAIENVFHDELLKVTTIKRLKTCDVLGSDGIYGCHKVL